jgi:hypothetical protein
MALVDSEQIEKSITNAINVWHTIFIKFVSGIAFIRVSNISLIGAHCEVWIEGLTIWSLCHPICALGWVAALATSQLV